MKNKLFLIGLVVFFVLSQLAFAAGQKDDSAAEEKIVITFAHMNAVGGLIDQTAQKFKELVEAKTDKVEVRIHPSAQLGDTEQNMEGLKLGTVQICMSNPDYLAKRIPEFVVFTLPYMFSGYDHVEKAMDSEVGDKLSQMLVEQQGIRILAWGHNGFRNMASNTPIYKMADFKGVKFRSPAIPVYVEMFKAIGASPTPIPWPEAYSAVKQGIVDGLETTPEGFYSSKVYEVADYAVMTNHLYTALNILISEAFYKGLPPDVQKAIDEAGAELEPWQRKTIKDANNGIFAKVEKEGMTILEIDTTEMREACKPVWSLLTVDAPKALEFADMISALIK